MAGGNGFLRFGPQTLPDAPRRFYAMFDQVNGGVVQFDAIGADFFDALTGRHEGVGYWRDHADDAPIFVIEIERLFGFSPWFVQGAWEGSNRWEDSDDPVWFELTLDSAGAPATLYRNLYSPGQTITLQGALAPADRAAALTAAFTLDDYIVTKDEIEKVLSGLSVTIDWVGV